MAIFRTVSLSFWTDAKVEDDFTPEDKYFYLYLITNPHTSISGCYEISKRALERETGYTWETVSRLLHRMEHVHDVIRYDESTKEVLILHWGKYNWRASDTVIKAVLNSMNHIKNKEYREFVLNALNDKNFEAPAKVVKAQKPKAEPAQTLEPPTLRDVESYVELKDYDVDARLFYYYYDQRGWQAGGKPIQNWKKVLDACASSGDFERAV